MTWRVHLLPRFPRIELLTEASCEDYYRGRLRKVSRATVKKERGTLVRFVRWASIRGRDYLAPMGVPSLPKKAKGTKALDGRDKTHVTRAEVLAILDRLPERSRAEHPVKAFATLAAELGIRRETMDKLEVPKHYESGAEFLRLSADIDKEGNGRPLWLSPRARAALEEVAPAHGRIFSGFYYLKTFRAAARPVVGEERARHLTLRDLRHRCLTDIAEREGLAAAAYVGGHRSTEMAGRVHEKTGSNPAQNPAQKLSWNPGLRFCPRICSGREGIRTPDFCLRRPNHQPESSRFPVVLGEEPRATERDEAPLTPLLGPVVPKDIELSARRALADPNASNRELTLAQWILRRVGR